MILHDGVCPRAFLSAARRVACRLPVLSCCCQTSFQTLCSFTRKKMQSCFIWKVWLKPYMYMSVRICVCVYIGLLDYVCIHICAYVCTYMYIRVYVYTYACSIHTYMYLHIYTHMPAHICMCLSECVDACVIIWVYMYIFAHLHMHRHVCVL